MKLAQFVYLIHSFKPIDFEKKSNKQYGKSSHFKLKISNTCLRDKMCICNQIFVKLAQFISSISSILLILEKKYNKLCRKSSHFRLKIFDFCLRDKVRISCQIFLKITQFILTVASTLLILKKNPINNIGVVAK